MTTEQASILESWPDPRDFKRSIRRDIALYMTLIVLILMGTTGYVISNDYVSTVTREVVAKMLVQARAFSSPSSKLMLAEGSPDMLLLGNICQRISADNADVYWAGITDETGTYVAHSDIQEVINRQRATGIDAMEYGELLQAGEKFSRSGDTLSISVPIAESGVRLGELFIAASAQPIEAARAKSIRSVTLITFAILALGIPVSLTVIRRKLNPLSVITAQLKQVDIRDFNIAVPAGSNDEFGYLAETLRTMGSRLGAAQKHLIESERIARELEIARDIQYSLLPKSFPTAAQFSVSGEYMSAREVGGDYYDFIEFDDKHLGIIVADVSGKSLPGMLVMLMTRDLVKSLCRELRDPARILTDLNRELNGSIRRGMFVTMFLGILNRENGEFCYASAGHNPLIHIDGRTGEVRSVKTKGFPLGTAGEAIFSKRIETHRLHLGDDDWLVQFTDGVNEAHNAVDEEYGTERFMGCLASAREKSPQMLVSHVMQDLKSFVGDAQSYDDITLVALKWRPKSTDHEYRVAGAVNAG